MLLCTAAVTSSISGDSGSSLWEKAEAERIENERRRPKPGQCDRTTTAAMIVAKFMRYVHISPPFWVFSSCLLVQHISTVLER